MLNDIQFMDWALLNEISNETLKYINVNIRKAQPVRSVRGGKQNFSGLFSSKKMGTSIQYESWTIEKQALLLMEYEESNVLEYYDQPNQFVLNYYIENRNVKKKKGFIYTPDFFVIREKEAGWEEWKTENELEKLSVEKPWRYQKDKDGRWRCPPGEEFAAKKGLYFRVRSDAEFNWVLLRNLNFLESYLKSINKIRVEDNDISEIKELIISEKGINLKKLIKKAGEKGIQNDTIYFCIVNQHIFVDLHKYLLSEPEKVFVFTSKEQEEIYSKIINSVERIDETLKVKLEVGKKVLWDDVPWKIINVGVNNISLKSNKAIVSLSFEEVESLINKGEIIGNLHNDDLTSNIVEAALEKLMEASEEDLIVANERHSFVKKYVQGDFLEFTDRFPKARTVRDWVRKYNEAEQLYGSGLIGLLPNHKKKGNRNKRHPESVRLLMHRYIEEEYENKVQKNRIHVYGLFAKECKELGFDPPSYITFCEVIKNRPRKVLEGKRRGQRAAYQEQEFFWELDFHKTPRHGEYSFNICHLDHTELDIELVNSTNGKGMNRPYLSLMMDAFNRRVIAFYLSFQRPSYRSCMMVNRDAVRRHNRLPQTYVVDNGKEFKSIYFQTQVAMFEGEIRYRPPGSARGGSVLERLFGTTNTKVIHNLCGNTKIMKEVRIVTKRFNPKNNAIVTLEELYKLLEYYFFEIYNSQVHPSLNGLSPKEMYESSLIFGERKHTFIRYNQLFYILTLPSTKKGNAKIQPSRGIKVNNRYYWNEILLDREVENTKVKVKFDPYNMGRIYAYVKKSWVECRCKDYLFFSKLTEKESMFLAEEMRKTDQNLISAYFESAEKIAEYLKQFEDNKRYQLLKLQVDEEKKLYLQDNDVDSVNYEKTESKGNSLKEEELSSNVTAQIKDNENYEDENSLDHYLYEDDIELDVYIIDSKDD